MTQDLINRLQDAVTAAIKATEHRVHSFGRAGAARGEVEAHGALSHAINAAEAAIAAQAPTAPDGYKLVLVPDDSAPDEPDWDEVKRQAEVAIGLPVETHTFSIMKREVRRWISHKQAAGVPLPVQAEPEDMADEVSKALRKAWQLGQTYWQQADSEYTSQHKKADGTQAKFQALIDETRAAILSAPPQQQAPAAQEPLKPFFVTPLDEQQMFDDWCPYKGNPDPRVVWAAAVEAVNVMLAITGAAK